MMRRQAGRSVVRIPLARLALPQCGRQLHTSACRLQEEDSWENPKWKKRQTYFDLKNFRKNLVRQKQFEEFNEEAHLKKAYAKPPPDGWGVLEFLQAIPIEENAEEIAAAFPTWNDFIGAHWEELYKIEVLTPHQRRAIWKKINLYNHGLWPPTADKTEYFERFKGKPLANAGKEWTESDDAKLLELAEYYDVNFGDPWLYISWDMQRTADEVRDRYVDIAVISKNRSRECELAITKSSRPLLMTRYFKMDPPFLYIVPSEDNFPLAPMNFSLSAKLVKYRRAECFAPHGRREREREGVSEFDIGGKRREVMADKEEGAGGEGKTLAEMQT
ncbi:unnamed protein product [Vitrella brassicaformis CCMP3155]|uniref:Myb-like domain-containing protein n=1 Tax=Vitrella brassicaformis (strain CCMP3155) TaxID=1169540 RepID=A0A0G4ETI7_VITBC|nr:unnamed protein product [Vitrella brassicaformis CCMP3155]|eukprot:CEM01626.1 unnamed protein product [Vitrella brassicaformis CCMP3155]